MKILAITSLYPNPYQPLRATFNRDEFHALSRRHPLAVIAPIAWTDEVAGRKSRGKALPRDRRAQLDGLTIEHPRYLFTPRILRSWYGRFYRLSVQSAFDRVVREFQPDLIYAPWAYPDGWAAVELGRASGLPVVVKVHGSDVLLLTKVAGRAGRTVETLKRADGVVAVSRDLARHVVELGALPERVHVVYAGIDRTIFTPGDMAEARARLSLRPDEPILLFVGNLVPVKGLDVLIDACALLKEEGRRFRCLMIGQGPLRETLERQVERLGLRDQVQLLGSKPNEQLPDWYRAATAFVLPSRSEGLPTVLREAVACGLPFVATRVGGIAEIAGNRADRLVPPDDPRSLAHALRETMRNPALGIADTLAPAGARAHDESAAELSGVLEEILLRYREQAGRRTTASKAASSVR